VQVAEEDMQRVSKATGARVQTTVNNLDPAVLGQCARFDEIQVRSSSTVVQPAMWAHHACLDNGQARVQRGLPTS
jgi:hypothetical protein